MASGNGFVYIFSKDKVIEDVNVLGLRPFMNPRRFYNLKEMKICLSSSKGLTSCLKFLEKLQ